MEFTGTLIPQATPGLSGETHTPGGAGGTNAVAIGGDAFQLLLANALQPDGNDLPPGGTPLPDADGLPVKPGKESESVLLLSEEAVETSLELEADSAEPRATAPVDELTLKSQPDASQAPALPTGATQGNAHDTAAASADATEGLTDDAMEMSDELLNQKTRLASAQTSGEVGTDDAELAGIDKPQPGSDAKALPAGGQDVIAARSRPLENMPLPNSPAARQGWQTALSEQVIWQLDNAKPTAQLRLNPPELGLIEVTVNMNRDQASVQFQAGNAMVRDTLQEALPRLREMLDSAGISLANAGVGGGEPQQREARGSASAEQDFESAGTAVDESSIADSTTPQLQGLVDTYA